MLTDLIIGIVSVVVGFFDSLLPSVKVPGWFTSDALGGLTTTVGDMLGAVKGVLPVIAMLTVLHDLLVFLPLALGYLIFDWVWNHSPTIMGTSL